MARAGPVSCDLHPSTPSVGTVAGKRGTRRPVCVECRDSALVLGLDFTFRSHEDAERDAVLADAIKRREQIKERTRQAAQEARRG